jgi:pilin isopeptide linkage protein
VTISAKFKKAQLSTALGAETAGELTIIHLPLTEEVRANVATTKDATELTVEDIQVEQVEGEISLSEKKGDTAEFALESLSLAAITNVESKVEYDKNNSNGNGTLTKQDILDAVGVARDFSVFAMRFNNSNHMEGNIAARTLTGSNSQMGNTNAVYESIRDVNISQFSIDITKTLENGGSGIFNFGVFANQDGSSPITCTFTENGVQKNGEIIPITVTNGEGSQTVTGSFPSNESKVYVYELDKDNKAIVNTNGKKEITAGQYYYVTYTDQFNAPLTSTVVSKSSNTSYIEFFENPQDSGSKENMFNSCNYEPATLLVGPDNIVTTNSKNQSVIASKTNSVVYEAGENVTVKRLDQFPIDFDTAFSEYERLSTALADAKTSTEVKVIDVKANVGDFPNAVKAAIGDNQDLNDMVVTFESGQFLLFNIDCTGLDRYEVSRINIKQGNNNTQQTGSWDTNASKIIINPYKVVNGKKVPFDGDFYLNQSSGTVLAPRASVNCHATVVGSIIGKEVAHDGGEIHKMTLEGMTAHGYAGVRNAPEAKLKLKKTVTTNEMQGAPNDTVSPQFTVSGVNGTYTVDYQKDFKNGECEITLPSGEYTVTESMADVKGYSLSTSYKVNAVASTGESATVAVSSTAVPVVEVFNDYTERTNKRSLTLKKTFAGQAVSEADMDRVRFTVTGPDGFHEVIYYNQFVDGEYWLEDLAEGTYTVTEDNCYADGCVVTTTYQIGTDNAVSGTSAEVAVNGTHQQETVNFTNTYSVMNGNCKLVLFKVFDGIDMAQLEQASRANGDQYNPAFKDLSDSICFEIIGTGKFDNSNDDNNYYKIVKPESNQWQEQYKIIRIELNNLRPGNYVIKEINADISGKELQKQYSSVDLYRPSANEFLNDSQHENKKTVISSKVVHVIPETSGKDSNGNPKNYIRGVEIKNTYKNFTPVYAPIAAKKELTGDKTLEANEFEFTIRALDNADETPLPSKTVAKNLADGLVSFGEIKFNKSGTFNYVIEERNTGEEGVTYDDTKYYAKVVVTANNGVENPSAPTVTYYSDAEMTHSVNKENIKFVNTYEEITADPGQFTLKKWDGKENKAWDAGDVTFTLKDNKNEVVSTQTVTAQVNELTFENLTKKGSPYKLTESHDLPNYGKAPELTVKVDKDGNITFGGMDESYYSYTGSGKDAVVLTVTNPEKVICSLKLKKIYADPVPALTGAELEAYNSAKNKIKFTVTGGSLSEPLSIPYSDFDEDGEKVIPNLEPGTYTVKEEIVGENQYPFVTTYQVGQQDTMVGREATVTLSGTARDETVEFNNTFVTSESQTKAKLTLEKSFTDPNPMPTGEALTAYNTAKNNVQFTIIGQKTGYRQTVTYADFNDKSHDKHVLELDPDTYTVTEENYNISGYTRTTTHTVTGVTEVDASTAEPEEAKLTLADTDATVSFSNTYNKPSGKGSLLLYKTFDNNLNTSVYTELKEKLYFEVFGESNNYYRKIKLSEINPYWLNTGWEIEISGLDEGYYMVSEKNADRNNKTNIPIYFGVYPYNTDTDPNDYKNTTSGSYSQRIYVSDKEKTGQYPFGREQYRVSKMWIDNTYINQISGTADLKAKKELNTDGVSGNPKANQFNFTLEPDETDAALIANYPMPSGTVNGKFTKQNDASGNVNFDTITYHNVGVYKYKITEVINSNDPNYVYDAHVYHAIVTVTANTTGQGTTLNAAVSYDSGTESTGPTFVNKTVTGSFKLKKVGATDQPFEGGDVTFKLIDENGVEKKSVEIRKSEHSDMTVPVDNLSPGTYVLKETHTPSNYMGLPKEKAYYVKVAKDGTVTFDGLLQSDGELDGYVEEVTPDGANQTKVLQVKNYAYVDMPESGSRSALYCFILGSLLTLVGCYILFHRERGAE